MNSVVFDWTWNYQCKLMVLNDLYRETDIEI